DLKPGNVKIAADGSVKVPDFGLAKLVESPPEGGHYLRSASPNDRSVRLQPDLTNSPTIMSPAVTGMGVILGTAAYMSPEQARGKPVDKRADIWAFGVVLYEMLTGTRLFKGDDPSETLASVIKDEPTFDGIPVATERLLRKCLEKDPRKRL